MTKDDIRKLAREQGFSACGFARAEPVKKEAVLAYRQWIDGGLNFSMHYMENYQAVRDNPTLLLDDARTVISFALNYYPEKLQPSTAPQFSYYAYGRDYHDVVRDRLRIVAGEITARTGCRCRVCVDTAPIRERYWAQQAGIGFIGRNNQLIIPGKGSYFFLGEIVTTLSLQPDKPCSANCGTCRRCIDACPANALPGNYGALDARRCLSCLTIEHRGELPEKMAEKLGNRVYGCDACQQACPHNSHATPTAVEEFTPSEEFLHISYESMGKMTEDDYRRIFRRSAVKRAKYSGLMRNYASINHLKEKQ